jgi:CRP/FNR family cyclic AMP-dependent transcriptional regulator
MNLKKKWAERFVQSCSKLRSARRTTVPAGQTIYSNTPEGRCWIVISGYVKIIDPRPDGDRIARLIIGRGSLFGDRPFATEAFRGFISPQDEQVIAHGPVDVLELDRAELEAASRGDLEIASLLLESVTSRALFLERRLLWQFTTPVRARVAATLRDLICFEGQRCAHGHTIDVRLTHQDLAELVGAARPVINAELTRMRSEGLIEYTRCHFCVDDLAGLNQVAIG